MRQNIPNMPTSAFAAVRRHLIDHHLSPEQVGQLAASARVSRVVVTHQVPGSRDPVGLARYRAGIARFFKGEIGFANDLDRL